MEQKGCPLKVLFVHQRLWPYVERDLKILQSKYYVRECFFPGPGFATPNQMLRNILLLFCGVFWCDVTYSWFGKLHAFFAVLFSKLLGKRAIVVAGDDDVCKFTDGHRHYGVCAHPFKKWFAYFTFALADRILAVSKYSLQETILNVKANSRKVNLIYHGLDITTFYRSPQIEKQRLVITIGQVTYENLVRKGLQLFVDAARLLPSIPFLLVGPHDDGSIELLRSKASPNVTIAGRLPLADLIRALNEAIVYVQASLHEGFGCSVAEAMLCGCVPVVSNLTALPEVVGDCGFYLDRLDSEELAAKIKLALDHPEMGMQARQRIIEHFPLEKRKQAVLEVVDTLT